MAALTTSPWRFRQVMWFKHFVKVVYGITTFSAAILLLICFWEIAGRQTIPLNLFIILIISALFVHTPIVNICLSAVVVYETLNARR